jgi:hypothetical protein
VAKLTFRRRFSRPSGGVGAGGGSGGDVGGGVGHGISKQVEAVVRCYPLYAIGDWEQRYQ